jgi:hypothetical protein
MLIQQLQESVSELTQTEKQEAKLSNAGVWDE